MILCLKLLKVDLISLIFITFLTTFMRQILYAEYIMCLLFWFLNVHSRTKVDFSIGGESFHCVGQRVLVKGFTSIMPWLAINEKNLPQFTKGEKLEVSKVDLHEVDVHILQISLLFSFFCKSPQLIQYLLRICILLDSV